MDCAVITGATSPLGVAITTQLLQDCVSVVAVVRPNSKNTCRLPQDDRLTVIPCDLYDLKDLTTENVGHADVFFHLGWDSTDKIGRNNPELQERNINSSLQAVKLAASCGCECFIGAGSQAEYGPVDDVISTDHQCRPVSAYGSAKLAAGQLTREACLSLDIKHIWCRVFSLYGRYDSAATMISYCLSSLLKGETPQLSSCTQPWDYLHFKDAARAFIMLAQNGKAGEVYHCASGESHPLKYFTEIMRRLAAPHLEICYSPGTDSQIFGLQANVESLKRDIRFTPLIDFEQGILDTIAFMRGRESQG